MDTHVWLRAAGEAGQHLSPRARAEIDRAAGEGRLHVSAISVWELGMLAAKGRIRLQGDCLKWVMESLSQPGVVLAPLSPEIAIASSNLSGAFPGDPADRIVVATARMLGAALMTRDTRILEYGRAKYVLTTPA